MTTIVPKNCPSTENLSSVQAIKDALLSLNYPILALNASNKSISTAIEVNGRKYAVLIDINDDGTAARIEAKIGQAGDLPEDVASLATIALSLLSLNGQITPFAIAIYPADNADESPLTLVDEIPLGDLSTGELESAMMSCRRALLLVSASLKTPGSCGAGCGCSGPQ